MAGRNHKISADRLTLPSASAAACRMASAVVGCMIVNVRPLATPPMRDGVVWLARSRAKEASLSTPSIISIVDDDASVRASMNNVLRSHGYIVHTFASAEEFLVSSHLTDTSCVIADVQMAAMSGLDLLVTMRVRGHDAPFIIRHGIP